MSEPPRLPDPDSCFWCDQPQRGHMQRYMGMAGWHVWTPPTSRMRLARMKARRAARLEAKTQKPYAPPNPAVIYTFTVPDPVTPIILAIAEMLGPTPSHPDSKEGS